MKLVARGIALGSRSPKKIITTLFPEKLSKRLVMEREGISNFFGFVLGIISTVGQVFCGVINKMFANVQPCSSSFTREVF